MKNKMWLPLGLSIAFTAGCANTKQQIDSTTSFLQHFSKQGSSLPYTVLANDLNDATIEIHNGGYGSAMTKHPTNKNQFYALTDRGPNAKYTGRYGKGKIFPVASYTPRIGLFTVETDGNIVLDKEILLRRPAGGLITGLPNTSALGGTGETPYHADGSPVLVNDNLPYDSETNPIKLDNYGLDGEGLVALQDGTFWVSDEYGPHIVHFDNNGLELERINAFQNDRRDSFHLPAVFQHRRANRGMEGLAITPDENMLVGIMQSTMANPNKAAQNGDLTRIVTVNLSTGESEQYLYRQQKRQNANSEIATLTANKFLVIERDGSFLLGGPKKANPDAQKMIYRIDLSTGTKLSDVTLSSSMVRDDSHGLLIDNLTLEQYVQKNGWDALAAHGIKPVDKSLLADMVQEVSYAHDKMEGLWVIDEHHLGVLNDDDFSTWSNNGKLEQKYIDNNRVDTSRLYIINKDLLGK